MTAEQITNLYIAFKTLSPEIKERLTSDEASNEIDTMSKQYILSTDQEMELPLLLLRLVTQNLPPEQFKSALAEALAIDHALAEKITDALAEKILAPIKQPLQSAGVNIDLLKFDTPHQNEFDAGQAPHQGALDAGQTPAPEKIAADTIPQNQQSASSAQNPTPPIQNKPFVLHEEPSFSRDGENTIVDAKPSFIFNPAETMNTLRESAPAKVIIERVVHYNQLRTPLHHTSVPPLDSKKEIKPPKTKWFI